MQLSDCDRANHWQQNLPQGKQTFEQVGQYRMGIKANKFLTDISVTEALHCSLIDFTIHSTEGSKKEATSELRKDSTQY